MRDFRRFEVGSLLIPVGNVENICFFNSLEHYSTLIFKNNIELVKRLENFYCRYVYKSGDVIILSGFEVDEYFYRTGTLIYLDGNLDIIKKKSYLNFFSEIFWSDGIVCCGNSYKKDENKMNGDIFYVDNFERIKLPVMLTGEYELRGGIKLDEGYLFFGVDKDNYRGIVVKLFGGNTELLDIDLENDLWDFVKIGNYDGKVILCGNKWSRIGFEGFVLFLEGDDKFDVYNISLSSSWYEVIDMKVNDFITLSVFDYDTNLGMLLEFNDGEFNILERNYKSQYIFGSDGIFLKKL
ncbi:MAG: hypothetical protein ACK4F9_03565 [Brevinematia bacterium]